MDLRKLQHATMLAAEGNFARAAVRLHITQSALSQSIARLEAETGFALFDRDRGGARPTSAGKSFLARAEALLQQARNLEHETLLLRGASAGSVGFGFGPVPASALLGPILAMLAQEHPALTSNVRVADTLALMDDLTEERIEFFVAAGAALAHQDGIALEKLADYRIGFFVRKKHPLANRQSIAMKDVAAFPLLSPQIAEADRERAKKRFGLAVDASWPPTIFCDEISALRQLALDSDGVLLGPSVAVAADCAAGRLVELTPRGLKRPGAASVSVVSLAGRSLSPAARMIIGRLKVLARTAVSVPIP